MRAAVLTGAIVTLGLVACELPFESEDRMVVMLADWTPPVGPLAANSVVAGEPAVVITDAQGRPRRGVVVAFQPIVPPLVVFASVDTTGADGRAVMPTAWQVGSQPGTHRLIVHVPSGQSNSHVVYAVEVEATP